MPEYPLLPLPRPEKVKQPAGQGFPPSLPSIPSKQRQRDRLAPTFSRLKNQVEKTTFHLSEDPSSLAPERALVFEVVGSIGDFYSAARKISGLEFLLEEEVLVEPDDDFAFMDERKGRAGQRRADKLIEGRLYLAMPDLAALRQILSLWNRWDKGLPMYRGYAPWGNLFDLLKDVRPWGPQDRIPEETVRYWRDELVAEPDRRLVRTEVELWHFRTQHRRNIAFQQLSDVVGQSGGTIIHHAQIAEIGYNGALVDLPASEIPHLANREYVGVAICDDVMFLRPQTRAAYEVDISDSQRKLIEPSPIPTGSPIAALFDAVPVQNHQLIASRIVVDDPDDFEHMSVVNKRVHGTAMASLIIHGDRNRNEGAIRRPLYVRPVMYAPDVGNEETIRNDRLLIDTMHRAVKRMKEGDESGGATAPDVFIVNISLGDPRRPFSGPMSPWARLLDHLSEHYGILFLVSAGNILEALPITDYKTWTDFESADPRERSMAIVKALQAQKATRTLLSPAEALNILTIGAWHEDAVADSIGSSIVVDPFGSSDFPNISSALGLGHRRVVKPDLHLPGGKERVRLQSSGDTLAIVPARSSRMFGLRVAMPAPNGDLDREGLTSGTSAATALATRAAHLIYEVLMDGEGGSFHSDIDPDFLPVVVKALLIHRANWGGEAKRVDDLLGPKSPGNQDARRDDLSRLFGYGRAAIEESMACADNRATMVGYGTISEGQTITQFKIPLPSSLERVTEPRAITITVAWMSPVNFQHQAYRRAVIDVTPISIDHNFGVDWARWQPSQHAANRGTVSHRRYEGNKAVAFVDEGHINIHLHCRAPLGPLGHEIRYGFAVTIEAGQNIPVYQEIRAKLGIMPRVAGP